MSHPFSNDLLFWQEGMEELHMLRIFTGWGADLEEEEEEEEGEENGVKTMKKEKTEKKEKEVTDVDVKGEEEVDGEKEKEGDKDVDKQKKLLSRDSVQHPVTNEELPSLCS